MFRRKKHPDIFERLEKEAADELRLLEDWSEAPAAFDAASFPGPVEAVIPQFAEFNLDKAKGFARYVVLGALGPVGGKRAARIEQTRSAGELRAELDELRDVLPKLMPKRQAEQVWKQLEPLMLSIAEAPSVSTMPQILPP